jgi:hypothetical protein
MATNFLPDEKLLKEGGATRYGVGLFKASAGRGTLQITTHRLIFKPPTVIGIYGVEYPLSHITHIAEARAFLAPVIQLTFDNGTVEEFSVFGVAEWIAVIEQARAKAPVLPYSSSNLSSETQTRILIGWAIFVIAVVGVFFVCIISLLGFFMLMTIPSR